MALNSFFWKTNFSFVGYITNIRKMATDEGQTSCRRRAAHLSENNSLDPDYDLRDTLFREKPSDSAEDEEAEEVGNMMEWTHFHDFTVSLLCFWRLFLRSLCGYSWSLREIMCCNGGISRVPFIVTLLSCRYTLVTALYFDSSKWSRFFSFICGTPKCLVPLFFIWLFFNLTQSTSNNLNCSFKLDMHTNQ